MGVAVFATQYSPFGKDRQTIEGTAAERRLYELIWKRTIASQMADAQIEKTTVTIGMDDSPYTFIATGEVVRFDGFLRVYREAVADDSTEESQEGNMPR